MKILKLASSLILPLSMIATVATAQDSMPDKKTVPNQQTMPDKPMSPNDHTMPNKPAMPSDRSTSPMPSEPMSSDAASGQTMPTADANMMGSSAAPNPAPMAQTTYPPCSATVKDQCMQRSDRKMAKRTPRNR